MIAIKKQAQESPAQTECNLEKEPTQYSFEKHLSATNNEHSHQPKRAKKEIKLIDEEIPLDPKKYILSKTDPKGIIEYGNDYFVEISGYREDELVGKPHNIIRHPDMPRVVFKLLWDRIKKQENIIAVVKNRAKDGRYYWVMTDFEIKTNEIGEITGYFAYRRAAPREAIAAVEPIYKKLLEIEKASGMEGSEKYLNAYFEAQNTSYDKFINEVTGRNSNIMKMWFMAMKKMFSHH